MDHDDEVMVVIIGDEEDWHSKEQETTFPTQVMIKEEQLDETDVMYLLETAEKYGEPVALQDDENATYVFVKSEVEDTNYEENQQDTESMPEFLQVKIEQCDDEEYIPEDEDYMPDDEYEACITKDNDDEEYIPDNENENISDDEDYIPEDDEYMPGDEEYIPEDEENLEVRIDSGDRNKVGRRSMLRPHERKSFIEDLKVKYPDLRKNSKELVKALAEIMRNVKKPDPPRDYFIMNDTLFECRKCGCMSNYIAAAERHYREKHGPRYLVCYACGVDFRSTTNLYKHEKRCVAPDAEVMLRARALYLGNKAANRPFISKRKNFQLREPVKKFACQQCSAVYFSRANLEAHENLHRGHRPYRCHVCTCAYTSEVKLKRHLKKHSDEVYICDHCSRTFKIKAGLVAHMNTHLKVPKFLCEKCSRRYATKAALTDHVRRVHLHLPPPCACQICPKRYSRMSLLRDHMKAKHGMSIMTRRMFFTALPTLSESQLQQAKKIVTATEPLHF